LIYVEHQSLLLDISLILLTVVAVFSRPVALRGVNAILIWLKASDDVIRVCKREAKLIPHPPPGSDLIVTQR